MEAKKKGKSKSREHKTPKEKKDVKHKRGLLDILDIHACAGSEIGGKDLDTCPEIKDKLPYAPSQKSMPTSSFSEESDVNVAEKCEPIEKPRKNIVHKKIRKEISFEDLLSLESKIKDLGDKTMNNEMTVNRLSIQTGCDTFPIKQSKESVPDMLETSIDSLLNEKNYKNEAHPFTRNTYKTIAYSTDMINKSDESPFFINCSRKNSENISPSIGKVSKKTKKNATKEVLVLPDKEREELETNASTIKVSPVPHKSKKGTQKLVSTDKLVLQLFDCNNYPLTDYEGNILKSADGQDLVILKNGMPYKDCFKRLLYDTNGFSSDDSNFNAFSIKKHYAEAASKIILYDFRGYPLTDSNGAFLRNSKGDKLIIVDDQGKLLHDINGNPIFDVAGIPLAKKENCWLNPRGTPYRVFNSCKYPLTDKRGRVLLNRNNLELLICDKLGRPVLDINKELVFDENGRIYTDPKFNPTTPIEKDSENIVLLIRDSPQQIYNRDGFPLTDSDGIILKDAYGKHIINSSFLMNSRKTVMRGKNTVLSCKIKESSEEEISPKIKSWEPVKYGLLQPSDLPLTDLKGELVYNNKGEQVFIDTKIHHRSQSSPKNQEKASLIDSFTSESLCNYDSDTTLGLDSDSVKCEEETFVDFDTETDMFGRPLFEEDGSALFDKYGRPIRDLFLRPLYDSQGCPISTADGKLLKDGSTEMPGIHPGFDLKYLTLHDPEGILQLTDRQGGPIHDDTGHPLYNVHGKPLKDAFGRPLYDEDGKPLCNDKGLPASAIIKSKGLEIAEVIDKFQKLTVSAQDHQKIGIIDETKDNEEGAYSDGTYNARLRLTTFVNGETVVELLEISPQEENV